MIKTILNKEQFDQAIASKQAIVDFNAVWCGPCQMLKPIIEKMSEENPSLDFYSLDTDQVPEACERYGVFSIPTIIVFEDGKEKKRNVGYLPEPGLKKFLGL